jgi:hypothetical protein
MTQDPAFDKYRADLEKYASEMVREGHITHDWVAERRRLATSDADLWVSKYGDRIPESAKEDLHKYLYLLQFGGAVRTIRIKAAMLKMDMPNWFYYAKPILQNDGTVVLCADATIERINKINSMLDARIGKIIEMPYSGPEYLTLS